MFYTSRYTKQEVEKNTVLMKSPTPTCVMPVHNALYIEITIFISSCSPIGYLLWHIDLLICPRIRSVQIIIFLIHRSSLWSVNSLYWQWFYHLFCNERLVDLYLKVLPTGSWTLCLLLSFQLHKHPRLFVSLISVTKYSTPLLTNFSPQSIMLCDLSVYTVKIAE